MNMASREKYVGYTSYRISHAYMRVLDQRIRPLGIGASESFIIMYLKNQGPKSLVEIARHVGHAHPTIVRHIDAMEKAGVVERRRHESDGRVKVIHLTDHGEAMIPKLLKIYKDTEAGAICGLEKSELATFMKAAHQMNDNLQVMAGPESEENS